MFFETFTVMGSIAGFATGAIKLHEYLTKTLPLFVFDASEPSTDGRRELTLRVINRSDRLMMVRAEKGQPDGHLRLVLDDTSRSAIGTAMGLGLAVAVNARNERRFELMNPPDYESIPLDHDLFVIVRWRFAQPFMNLPERTRVLRIAKRDLVSLKEGDGYRFD